MGLIELFAERMRVADIVCNCLMDVIEPVDELVVTEIGINTNFNSSTLFFSCSCNVKKVDKSYV